MKPKCKHQWVTVPASAKSPAAKVCLKCGRKK